MAAPLLERFRGGDKNAFQPLVDKYAEVVFNTARRMVRNEADAEDATQETFAYIARNANKYMGGSERAYVCGVAVRYSLNTIRSRRRRRERERKFAVEKQNNSYAGEQLNAELKEALENALSELPHKLRAAVVLHHIEGLTSAEVAQALSIREGTAKSRTSRALGRMRKRLAESGFPAVAALPALMGQLPRFQPSATLIEVCKAAVTLVPAAAAVKIVVGGALMKKAQLAATVIIVLALSGICTYVVISGERLPWVREKPVEIAGESEQATAPEPGEEAPAPVALPTEKESENAPAAKAGNQKPKGSGEDWPPEMPAQPKVAGADKGDEEGEWTEVILPDGTRARIGKGQGLAPGGSPPLRPTGRSTRWAPEPREKGNCVLSGHVVDSTGNAVAGAQVCSVAPNAPKKDGMVSFAHIRRITTTGEDGSFSGNIQEGKWVLVANYRNILNGRWGLKVASGVEVELAPRERKGGVTLRLPLALGDMGSISGKVQDQEGDPLAGVSVSVDYLRVHTNKHGEYKLEGVLPGEKRIVAHCGYGFKDGSAAVTVKAGDVLAHVDITLELKEKGEFSVSGTVRDTKGAPIEGAIVYLNAKHSSNRRGYTDSNGFYEFKNLKENKVSIQVTPFRKGYQGQVKSDVQLPAQNVDFILQRVVKVTVKIVDSATGEPVKKFNVRCYRVDESGNKRHFRSQANYSENGETSLETIPGGILLEVEAPNHEKGEFNLAVPDAETWETTLQLAPSMEELEEK